MADLLINPIPLPLPRPVMEETVPGGVLSQFKLDIPFSPVEIDLSFPKVGMNWFLEKYTQLNPFSFSIEEDKHLGYVLKMYNNATEVLFFIVCISIVAFLITMVALGIEKILEKLGIIGKDR